jgi:hypothetical protein
MNGGTVGVCAQDTGRFTAFTEAMRALQTPSDTHVMWRYGSHIVNGMNYLADNMVGDWLWIMGDDHTFDPHLLLRLLDHRVDVVVPVCLMRQQPFLPVVRVNDNGDVLDLAKLKPSDGLIEIHSAGSAGMLIRKPVLDKLKAEFDRVFEENPDISEDFLLCQRIRELGFSIHCDLGSRLGHLTVVGVWPGVAPGGRFCVEFQIADSFQVNVGLAEASA